MDNPIEKPLRYIGEVGPHSKSQNGPTYYGVLSSSCQWGSQNPLKSNEIFLLQILLQKLCKSGFCLNFSKSLVQREHEPRVVHLDQTRSHVDGLLLQLPG